MLMWFRISKLAGKAFLFVFPASFFFLLVTLTQTGPLQLISNPLFDKVCGIIDFLHISPTFDSNPGWDSMRWYGVVEAQFNTLGRVFIRRTSAPPCLSVQDNSLSLSEWIAVPLVFAAVWLVKTGAYHVWSDHLASGKLQRRMNFFNPEIGLNYPILYLFKSWY